MPSFCIQKFFFTPPKVRLGTSIFTRQRHASFRHPRQISLEPFRTQFYWRQLNPPCVHFVLLNLPITETRLKQFQLETKNDPILQTLINYPTHEWPEKHLTPTDLLLYYTHPSDIISCGGFLFKNERIIVPTTLQAEIKSLIHQGHLGIENCKKRATQSLFWPLMNSGIEDMIKKCPTPLTSRNRQPSEPIPNQASIKIAAGSFCLYGHY